ncbi:MAG: hypothetical protein A3F30_04335 [Candidatus Levybacteria bacterium RIFCSPHIGHO2_12_FULL_37_12]|nr:MAG: hypothetical protein A3C97_03645 [Candidatus Levybacteria bacterium RIFCSPHIGHO2_02_FULL_37_11]OGH29196.1 MAG: hypothetical protein A3F30_04335 [Candidatus Levybacteria bacterium RIFCSPHIGHO2_12_FULL_37_12]
MNNTKNIIIVVAITAGIAWLVFNSISSKNSTGPQTNSGNSSQVSGQSVDSHHAAASPIDETAFKNLVGRKAPDFTLSSSNNGDISISSLKGKKVVPFFNEGLMCYPACWNQIVELSKDKRLARGDIAVLNIVVDSSADWKNAISQMPDLAKSTVLFDTTKSVSQNYGVLALPSSMHRGTMPGHSYVVIDKTGIVRFVFDDSAMGLQNDMMISELSKIN